MFRWKKNPEKIESMASLLILGAFIPLDVSISTHQQFSIADCDACLLKNSLYIAALVIGGLSLLVKRGSHKWRLIVALGAMVFIAVAFSGLSLSVWHSVWSLVVLCLIGLQYRHDLRIFSGVAANGK